ncbi:MAG TPA: hypothetical protein VIK70_05110 [Lysobacter sp.]
MIEFRKDAAVFRICLCLLIVLASSGAAARDIKLSSANGESCPDSIADDRDPARASVRNAPPARETRAKPSVHGDAVGSGRLQSPRWHSFLPGMFR